MLPFSGHLRMLPHSPPRQAVLSQAVWSQPSFILPCGELSEGYTQSITNWSVGAWPKHQS